MSKTVSGSEGLKNKEVLSGTEIEKKYKLDVLPEGIEECSSDEIWQGYLGGSGPESQVRIRKKGDQYFITEKIGQGLEREEEEIELSEEEFEELRAETTSSVERPATVFRMVTTP